MNITTKNETPMATTDDQPYDALTPENSRRAALRSLGKVGLGSHSPPPPPFSPPPVRPTPPAYVRSPAAAA
jgi:hypothetical protein